MARVTLQGRLRPQSQGHGQRQGCLGIPTLLNWPPMDILLTHGYFLALDERERKVMRPYPPLGLLYLSA